MEKTTFNSMMQEKLSKMNDDVAGIVGINDVDTSFSGPSQLAAAPTVWERALNSPTGEGELQDYLRHPLNFNNSEGMARIVRGATGLLGNLDLAIVDLLVGIVQVFIEHRPGMVKK